MKQETIGVSYTIQIRKLLISSICWVANNKVLLMCYEWRRFQEVFDLKN